MKLRIRDHSIRLRLTQTEVKNLIKKGSINSETSFPNKATFKYELSLGDSFNASFEATGIIVTIPADKANDWSRSEELSIEAFIENGEEKSLRLLIEKDLTCATDRPYEDDSDAFPNEDGC